MPIYKGPVKDHFTQIPNETIREMILPFPYKHAASSLISYHCPMTGQYTPGRWLLITAYPRTPSTN